jgi:YgiT-type zinc finger domain-containing protein
MSKLKCIFCNKVISGVRNVNIEKKYNNRIIAVKNIPASECKFCNEVFYSEEILCVVRYAIEHLSHKKQIIMYEDALYEYQKSEFKTNVVVGKIPNKAQQEEDYSILKDIFSGEYYKDCIRSQEDKLTYEEISEESFILLYHHSMLKPLKGKLMEKQDGTCSLAILNDLSILSFLRGDPIVVRFSRNHVGYNIGGEIKDIVKKKILYFSINELHYYREQRRSDRIPVSISAEVYLLSSNDRKEAIIKDISHHGLLICTKAIFTVGSPVNIDIYTSRKIVTFTGAIVREVSCIYNNEYGIEIIKVNKDDLFYLKKHLMYL